MSIQTLRLSGLLSFAPESTPLDLRDLNVLIGPNGSGKSNLIEAIELMAAMPRDLSATIRDGGGPAEWLWKGDRRGPRGPAEIDAVLNGAPTERPLRYRIQFDEVRSRVEVTDKAIEELEPSPKMPPGSKARCQLRPPRTWPKRLRKVTPCAFWRSTIPSVGLSTIL